MGVMVFCPMAPAAVRAFADTGRATVTTGYAATSPMRAHFGYQPGEDEDADYAAQLVASVAALAAGADRLVVAVETDSVPRGAGEQQMGQVGLGELGWRDVRALFRDDPDALEQVRAYREEVGDRPVAELWELEATTHLVEEHGLLWFDPSEVDQVLEGLRGPEGEG